MVKLHDDLRTGELSLAIFAADLYDVVMGRAKPIYQKAEEFFALTYPTFNLPGTGKRCASPAYHASTIKSGKQVAGTGLRRRLLKLMSVAYPRKRGTIKEQSIRGDESQEVIVESGVLAEFGKKALRLTVQIACQVSHAILLDRLKVIVHTLV